jgi:hypothetical protein
MERAVREEIENLKFSIEHDKLFVIKRNGKREKGDDSL